jgi:HEAT repeat protein
MSHSDVSLTSDRTDLIRLLRDRMATLEAREAAAYRLGHQRDRHVEPALTAVACRPAEPTSLRAEAARSLRLLRIRRATLLLIHVLQADTDAEVRASVAYALGLIGDQRAVDALIATLDDADERMRDHAAEALAYLNHERAILPLITALGDPSPEVH